MTLGVVLLILTGFCWVGIAAVVDDAARKRLDMDFIQFGASAVIALAAAGAILFRPSLTGTLADKLLICGCVFAAGACNFLMLSLMRRAMAFGCSGAVWGITQSAMVCPFAMGMVFFGVAPTLPRLGGILLILAGILLFSRIRGGRGTVSNSGCWLLPTFTAFAVSGLGQSLANLPSYWTATAMGSELRACLVQLGTISLFCASVPFRRKKPSPRGTLRPVLLLSLVQILSLLFLLSRFESGRGARRRFDWLSGCAGVQHCGISCLGISDAARAFFQNLRRSRSGNLHRHFSACNLKKTER